jgi:[ribosomal protein S5]-alanine N-acetyltransferase
MEESFEITSERLVIRKLLTDDKTFIYKLLNDPGWIEFIGDRNIKNEEDAEQYIVNGPQKSYETFGFGLWVVTLKNDMTPIGLCGFLQREDLDAPDIGFAYLESYTSQGFGTEAAGACMAYLIENFSYNRLHGITSPHNEKSKSLLISLGMTLKETLVRQGKETLLYSMDL